MSDEKDTAELQRIPHETLENHGRHWPDFFVSEKVMVKGCVFQIVDIRQGALVVKPYTARVPESEAKRIVADMIPRR